MIYSIHGILIEAEPYHIVVECNGIGYSVKTSLTTLSKFPETGKEIQVYTFLHVREDALELFGFCDKNELNTFKMLISINGVGPKAALSILSDLTPERFALCVASNDAKALTKAPGIGLKTAQRIILELKDRIAKEQIAQGAIGSTLPAASSSVTAGNASEAISALEVLGYSRAEATRAVMSLDSTLSIEEMIKGGLKALAGKV